MSHFFLHLFSIIRDFAIFSSFFYQNEQRILLKVGFKVNWENHPTFCLNIRENTPFMMKHFYKFNWQFLPKKKKEFLPQG